MKPNFIAVSYDDDWEQYQVIWSGSCICFTDAWNKFTEFCTEADNGEIVYMMCVDYGSFPAVQSKQAIVEMAITWEGP